jgi:hypothetical protein
LSKPKISGPEKHVLHLNVVFIVTKNTFLMHVTMSNKIDVINPNIYCITYKKGQDSRAQDCLHLNTVVQYRQVVQLLQISFIVALGVK